MYYLSQRESQRPAWRQGVSTEVLAMHAVFYFLADLDSGRLVGLLEDALE